MEWMVPVNQMLKEEITKLNSTLIPPGCPAGGRTVRAVQASLGTLIDALGDQSASAQGLSRAITTAEKLGNNPTHVLYLLKDAAGMNGDGAIIGFLKVAYKRLYLYDERDKVCEVEPLCVLDFFVSGARQRRGNGKKLFDYMLKDTGTEPHALAVDGPSSKMETFLAKNYGVLRLIKQSNNFAVSPAFFLPSAETKTPEECAPEPNPVPETPAPASPSPERPTTLEVAPAVSDSPMRAGSVTPRRDSQLTEKGFLDCKFYHSKLW